MAKCKAGEPKTDKPKSVYALLGFADHKSMEVKSRLASQIADVIKSKRLTQGDAAAMIGMTQPKLSGMLRGQFRGISEAKMMACLTALGRDVEIIIRPAPASRAAFVNVVSHGKVKRAPVQKVA